ncbi:MAG TPA: class I SAM-dependent methyltransferase [Saprospiraceae bacterium]|nr:class I SAM-dependent methyltransferase [Saprospiraceae bacterium]
MNKLSLFARLAGRYARYFARASTIYDLHSPFVAAWTQAVLEDSRHFYAFAEIALLRERLRFDRSPLRIVDYGAGSLVNPSPVRTVADLAQHAAIAPATGRQLFRLAQFCKPRTILEMGTSLGLSTLYLRGGALNARLITLEGCPDVAAQARQNFQLMNANSIELLEGAFAATLPTALTNLATLDLLFLDGDHRADATLGYFAQCLPFANEQSVFVIADIHWSEAMQQAWQQMRQHPRISLSIDVFHFGVLFFHKAARQTEHYTLVASRYKPWRLGLFAARHSC